MSREVLLLRHGRTPGNEQHRYNGVTDEPLSDAGREALRALRYGSVPVVYVTRLRRTRETAAILFPEAKQITVPGLREMDFGDFEGRNYADMADDSAYRAWVDSGCLSQIPNGECRAVFVARVTAAMRALLAADRSERITVVAHGGTIMALGAYCTQPRRDYFEWQPRNGGGARLRVLETAPELRFALIEEL